MTIPYEALSRLLDDELPADEAEELRRRIAEEPETAAAWRAVQRLPDRLASPPPGPPPELDRAVARRLTETPVSAPLPERRGSPRAPWAIAAAAALLAIAALMRPSAVPTLVAGERQWVEGRAEVLAGDVRVELDGVASILVEPAEPALRVGAQETESMDRTHLLAALAGAVVTVAVHEGSALLRAPEAGAEPIALGPGERVTVRRGPEGLERTERPPGRRGGENAVGRDPAGADPKDVEIAALREELARLRLASRLDRGRIEALEGVPQTWPEALPAVFRPEGFEAALRESLRELGGEIAAVDCAEYPCLAVLRTDLEEDAWKDWMDSLGAHFDESGLGGETELGLGMYGHVSKGPEGDLRLLGLALTPRSEGEEPDADLQARTNHRMGEQLRGLEEELRAETPTP